ncbi:MAG: glycosyl hydrolase [Cytophagales bacterium]|nr:glycosyl hydrolase [Cytophagales bacterium]
MKRTIVLALILLLTIQLDAQRKRNTTPTSPKIDPAVFSGVSLRNLSPAKTSGRIVDVAVHPHNQSIRLVAVASGGVWKTVNAGTTWKPVFDGEGSFSIGTVEFDRNNPNIAWVGTGENNAQRSVSMGDGVYKSTDGGESWTNVGLKTSEHIGKIAIHPTNSDIVYVAAQGSVWKDGGDRGLYKTMDGGKSWERVLTISETTGISDVSLDPRNPDVLIATAYQRRRHFGILVAGGPEGGAFKSTDGGKTWNKVKGGFPQGELGRIGIARSPQQPDVLYAIVAGTESTKGIYRSENNGENWSRMSDYMVIDAQYYMEIFPDPAQFDKIYIVDTFTKVSVDGGKTLERLNHRGIHVDNHEIEFDPNNPNYILMAGDGGIYETWDQGQNWRFTDNLPITQFYRVGIDTEAPFYNVYGGTQDNNTLGGPSQTINRVGIRNSDWYRTLGGDGFQTRVDPTDPNIVYSQYQYAGIVRYDRKSGERMDIQPQPKGGEPPYQWNWDSPLLISAHDHKTLYFAANKLIKSTDRGSLWREISGDLSRQKDRNQMEVMGRVWGIDAIFKNVWTSPYGTIVALTESPVKQGLLYAGTDDGLIQVTENDGQTWRKIEGIPGVPKLAYLSDLFASPHNENTVFAVFNYHKYGDYKPYFFRSDDKGNTWKNISSNLPAHEWGWTIYQDHLAPDLLFAGTEYGLHVSIDGGKQWIKWKSGIPTIAIRDIELQQRENDLVAASFGRGFYILDDYSFLRELSQATMDKEAHLFEVAGAWSYIQDNPDGGALGNSFFSSPNPAFGAVFTHYMNTTPMTLQQQRQKEEKQLVDNGKPVPYPDWKEFTEEKRESKPQLVFVIRDADGSQVASVQSNIRKGINRTSWNLRYAGKNGTDGPLVPPGKYSVAMGQVVNGKYTDFGEQRTFEVKSLDNKTLPATDIAAQNEFLLSVIQLVRSIDQADELREANTKALENARKAVIDRNASMTLINEIEQIRQVLLDLGIQLKGNNLIIRKMELIPPSINSRVNRIRWETWSSTSDPTGTQRESFQIAEQEFGEWRRSYNTLLDRIGRLDEQLKAASITSGLRLDLL